MNICVLFQYEIFRNRYRYFFWDQNFSKPMPILFFNTKIFWNRYRYFFSDTKIFWNRYRYFFWYQKFLKPIPILFSILNFFETDTDTIKTIGKFWNQEFFETEMSHSALLVWWAHRSGGPMGLVGLWFWWWARGSDGPMGLVDFLGCWLLKVQL